jgi:hypothetical protein
MIRDLTATGNKPREGCIVMRRFAVTAGAWVLILGARSLARGDGAPPKDEKLRAELLDWVEEDQKARKQLKDKGDK